MISIDNVSFGYGEAQETLSQVSAAIAPGECVLLCGASGCGKTTVTKLINGLIPAFTPGCRLEGRVEVDGLDPGTTPMYELARKVGSVFQNPKSQFFNLDTDSELAFGSVYAMGPEVFVLDEPTANLDQDAIARLHDQIACLKHQGRTVVIAEHRLYFLTDLIDRALYLRDGVLERTFNWEQFCGLTEQEREELGLRTLTPAACTLPAVAPAGTKEGLSVERLTCAYRKEPAVFQDLSFSARPGEVVSITGPNGVGKTTLSRCLCGLIREQAGQIQLDGRHLNRKGRQKAAFCVMQDVNHQLFSDSVWGECRMSAPDAPDSTVEEVLDSLHLLPFRERHPMSLSGGQKQRLAVATALLSEKPILIFDEPTSGLDYARMVEVSGVIRNLAQQGRIVLVVTHDREFMQRSCDRVLRL